MFDNKTQGIHCFKDNKFYYIESGKLRLASAIPRTIQTLTKRGLLVIQPNSDNRERQYVVMTGEEAKLKGLEIQPIYLNPHVREMVEKGETENAKPAGRWGQK
jgi:DNA replication protein DnaD